MPRLTPALCLGWACTPQGAVVPFPDESATSVWSLAGSSPTDVWMTTPNEAAWRWDGSEWHETSLPFDQAKLQVVEAGLMLAHGGDDYALLDSAGGVTALAMPGEGAWHVGARAGMIVATVDDPDGVLAAELFRYSADGWEREGSPPGYGRPVPVGAHGAWILGEELAWVDGPNVVEFGQMPELFEGYGPTPLELELPVEAREELWGWYGGWDGEAAFPWTILHAELGDAPALELFVAGGPPPTESPAAIAGLAPWGDSVAFVGLSSILNPGQTAARRYVDAYPLLNTTAEFREAVVELDDVCVGVCDGPLDPKFAVLADGGFVLSIEGGLVVCEAP